MLQTATFISSAVWILFCACAAFADWPQAAGPNDDYHIIGRAPTAFSVARNENIRWRTPLPNTGESTPIIAGGHIFITCHAPMTAGKGRGWGLTGDY